MVKPKVFGIGFHKTGTTSLGVIFNRLGYRVAGFDEFRDFSNRKDLSFEEVEKRALEIAKTIDAVKDSPWPIFYKSLDEAFPGSKFIHITRDPEHWIKSAVKDFGKNPNALRSIIYGSLYPQGNEAEWLDRYNRHNAEVASYFANRPNDYFHIRIEDGVSYEKICGFLGEPLVDSGVPKANTWLRKRLKMLWWRLRRR